MNSRTLTALASYCNNPNCSWASLDEEANQTANSLFKNWLSVNNWQSPWDGFIDLCNQNGYPSAKRVVKLGVGKVSLYTDNKTLARFSYYGSDWAIVE
ncbi:hypothetical protein [Nostoc sp.]|uniref:hypothetical protein n=1 Tax=Nostoc sp. TaxID=1180 RepID=UPI002D79E632|nr:hypothetical protein [Nostoc sp.]